MTDWRERLSVWAHLTVLWSFAVAQPLFETLADSPEFFVARGNTRADIVVFSFGVVLVPPTLLWLVELALSRAEPVRRLLHLTLVGALCGAIGLQILKSLGHPPTVVLLAAALAIGIGAALLYGGTRFVPTLLTVLAPAPAVFLFAFLVTSPVSALFASDDDVPVRHDVPASAPVVMVVLDEFSVEALIAADGRIDGSRFPNFAALARSAIWYRNATTIADHTTDAVPAILSGRYPTKSSLPIATDYPHNLFTLLGGSYSLDNVTEPATDLCPERLCSTPTRGATVDRLQSLVKDLSIVSLHQLFPQGLEQHLPEVTQGFGNFADQGRDAAGAGGGAKGETGLPGTAFEDRPSQFASFIAGIDRSRAHSLNFIHVLLPHTPWQYLPTGQQYKPSDKEVPGVDSNGVWSEDSALPQQARQRNALQVGYVDRLLGRLLRRLRQQGLYDKALFVLTADHGISFRSGTSRRSASGDAKPDVLGVPLFIKLPGQRGGRIDDGAATTADVLPSVAKALGIDLRWRTDGVALLGASPGRTRLSVSVFPTRKRVSMSFSDYVSARNRRVADLRAREGDRPGWGGIHALGPYAALFGRSVASLGMGRPLDATVQLAGAGSFASVRPHAAVLPAFVRGRLDGDEQPLAWYAVAVDGVICAVAPGYEDGGAVRFGALTPASAFREGRNDVAIYAISDSGSRTRLRRVPGR